MNTTTLAHSLPVTVDAIPQELRQRPQWVLWANERQGDDARKLPYTTNGMLASSTDPATWSTFDQCIQTYRGNPDRYSGIGYVFTSDDPYTGIDLDDCRNADGELESWADDLIRRLDSYTEISPSGTGLKIWIRAKLPAWARHRCGKQIEAYDHGRYFAMTGHLLDGSPATVNDRQVVLDRQLCREWWPDAVPQPQAPSLPPPKINGHAPADDRLLKRARAYADKAQAVAKGGRNDAAFRLAGNLAAIVDDGGACLADDAILDLMRTWNARNTPPLSDGELAQVVKSALTNGTPRPAKTPTPRINGPAGDGHDPQHLPLTDTGNAARFAEQTRDVLRFDSAAGSWRFYNGTSWAKDEVGRAMAAAKECTRRMLHDAAESDDKALTAFALKSQSRERLAAMVDLARSEPGMTVTPDQWDADPWALNVASGTINLPTGELRPHRAADLITKLAPVTFDAQAESPRWARFLNEIFAGDAALIGFVQRYFGHALTATRSEQLLLVCHGTGANGKSVALDTIGYVMGDYSGQAPPDMLTDSGFDKHPTEIADLCGKRLVVASETEKHRRLRVQLVKRLTGDEMLKARFMRGDFFAFKRTFALVLVTNNRPQVDEDSEAVWRRIRLLPFNVTIPPEKRDKGLLDKLKAESSGIINWLVAGCLAYQRDGLGEPPAVVEATQGYRAESDPLADFLTDCCTIRNDAWAATDTLRRIYERWCAERGEHPLAGRDWTDALRRHGAEPNRRYAGRGWSGIGLLSDSADMEGGGA